MTHKQTPHVCLSVKVPFEVAERLRHEAARQTIFERKRISVSDLVRNAVKSLVCDKNTQQVD